MDVSLVISFSHTSSSSGITLLVEASQVEPEEDDDEKQEDVATHVGAESNEVSGLIGVAEDLRALSDISLVLEVHRDIRWKLTDGVADRPGDEIQRYCERFLRLTGDVPSRSISI